MRKRHTIDEEQMSRKILLASVTEVLDDTIDILRRRHEQIHCLELLGFTVTGYRLDH